MNSTDPPLSPIAKLLAPDGWEIRAHYRARLRGARAAVQANAEGFEAIAFALEEFGRFLEPGADTMGAYLPKLLEFVSEATGEKATVERAATLERQYFLLRQSRNDQMHLGARARNAARIGVHLSLILEDALSIGWKDLRLATS